MKRIFTTIFAIVLMSSISLLAQTTPDYLCFTANEDGSSVSFTILQKPTKVTLQYQINGTSDDGWDYFCDNYIVKKVDLNKGDKVYIRNASDEVTEFSNSGGYYQFSMTGSIAASGNVMSLVDKSCSTKEIPNENCFIYLFLNCHSLTRAPELPATTLKKDCYSCMFGQCSGLTNAPELPAETLAEMCYSNMFSGCTSLTEAPAKLPAMTLADYCYSRMFYECTSLTEAPAKLPAMTLAGFCYDQMFYGCTSLTEAPALPATELAGYCYYNMFSGCTSLTEAPALPATTLAENCYYGMFAGCSSLTKAPELPATTLVKGCYSYMFGAGWDSSEEKEIYCSKLNYVKVGFSDWNEAGYATFIEDWESGGWLDGVSPTGTFVCPIDLEQKTGQGYIPEGWTVKHPVKAHLDEETGTHYATFYSGTKAYKLENATAYAGGELDSSVGDEIVLALMPLTRVGDVIPKDVPVVLKSSQSEILISETSESGTTPATNSLTGTDSKIDAAGEGISALSLGQNGIGFYLWTGKSIGAHRAYYKTTPKPQD